MMAPSTVVALTILTVLLMIALGLAMRTGAQYLASRFGRSLTPEEQKTDDWYRENGL